MLSSRTLRTFGPHHPRTLGVLESLSELAERWHRFDDAEVMRRRVYAGLRSAHPTDHPACVEARRALAMTLHARTHRHARVGAFTVVGIAV